MPRIKIALPETWAYCMPLPVRITDVNYGGHVGNDTLLAYLQEARVCWLRSLGYPSELLAEPVGLILVDLAVRLKAEAKYGDSLEIRVAVSEFTRVGFELAYQIVRPADGGEVARATTGFAFFDYARGALCPAPTGFREKAGAGLP
ncbi:MAG: acyl-CoA thioesterase [Kiritimatiellae bacterium]|nr:acyl-CoA thioesterase [Kiritimatiellia bacterium]